jgi:hypothetical protein
LYKFEIDRIGDSDSNYRYKTQIIKLKTGSTFKIWNILLIFKLKVLENQLLLERASEILLKIYDTTSSGAGTAQNCIQTIPQGFLKSWYFNYVYRLTV